MFNGMLDMRNTEQKLYLTENANPAHSRNYPVPKLH